MPMQLSDFDFELPDDLIAQTAPLRRDASRMLVVDRRAGSINDGMFVDLGDLLNDGDLLVVNNTKVFPARLLGETDSGARIEVFLVSETVEGTWDVLAKPAKRLSAGKRIVFDERLSAESLSRLDDGKVRLRFTADGDFYQILSEIGRTPLPPYIRRDAAEIDSDRERYQTVYAKNRGAIAAPTAGLHFTAEVFEKLKSKGVETAEITLHVGYGTFEPVRAANLSDHRVSPETYDIDANAATALDRALSDKRRIVAVGTTTTRCLESAIDDDGKFQPGRGIADLTITPGYRFRVVGALLTNFHLPQSSLLVLTSSFAGHDLIMEAYRHAVRERYRFYSYGDCMLIV